MVRKIKKMNGVMAVSWNKEPQTEAQFVCMGNELIAWAQQESSLAIDGFPISKMLSPAIFHALPNKSAQFALAYELALSIIGARREWLAHQGLLNAHIVRETMPLYDRMYRTWLINEKNNDKDTGQTKFITVEMPIWRSCPDGSHEDESEKYFAKEKLKEQQIRQQG